MILASTGCSYARSKAEHGSFISFPASGPRGGGRCDADGGLTADGEQAIYLGNFSAERKQGGRKDEKQQEATPPVYYRLYRSQEVPSRAPEKGKPKPGKR
jgi:hypothetical protein